MSISPVSSATSSNTSLAALLASVSSVPEITVVSAIADTPGQIQGEISQLELDEESPASGQSLAQIQEDIQQLQQAQTQQEQKTVPLASTLVQGIADSATISSSTATDSVHRLNAQA
jgi:hypothetical protein